jgi:L-iditol 2-dehydrogenase
VIDARESHLIDLDRRPGVLLECSGNARATLDGLAALDRAGRAVLVGMGVDELPLPVPLLQERELEVTGTFRYAGTWPTAIELVSSGRVDLDRLVTGSFALADSAAALTAGADDPTSVKVVVHPQT